MANLTELESKIDQQRKQLKELHKQQEQLTRQLLREGDTLYNLTIEYVVAKYQDIDVRDINWSELLSRDSDANFYMLGIKLRELLSDNTLSASGSRPEIDQTCIQMHLTYGQMTKTFIAQLSTALMLLLPHIKEHQGFKLINILEPSLSRYGHLSIRVKGNRWEMHHTRQDKPLYSDTNLHEFLMYLKENHSHDNPNAV